MSNARTTDFGARLKRSREAAELTQEELASKAGLTAKAISALERGERSDPIRTPCARWRTPWVSRVPNARPSSPRPPNASAWPSLPLRSPEVREAPDRTRAGQPDGTTTETRLPCSRLSRRGATVSFTGRQRYDERESW